MRLLEESKKKRKFIDTNLSIEKWDTLEPYFSDLEKRSISQEQSVIQWLLDRSELESVIEEDVAWRFINMNCNTSDKNLIERFNYFITEIEPQVNKHINLLDRKLNDSGWLNKLDRRRYFTFTRSIKKQLEIFREKNLPLIAEMQKKEQEYSAISSQMTIHYKEKELTLQQAANYLKNIDRNIRREVYNLIAARRKAEIDNFDNLFSELVLKRNEISKNADFQNYRDYRFASLGRFDYTAQDCFQFHESIKTEVCPLVDELYNLRKTKLKYSTLKPWDIEVDVALKPTLKPFSDSRELVNKTISCFKDIRKEYGEFIRIMDENGYLDLNSRKGKAPGGFNYPLYESNVPFIFMNSVGSQRDLETMVHEGGHAIHAFLSKDLELVHFKNVPAEVAELASMSMELISMDHWGFFYKDNEELLRARRFQLEGVIKVLPWIACIDKFQHWIYTKPYHTNKERMEMWKRIYSEYSSSQINWKGQEEDFNNTWQKQLHIFQYPFYYIEYGIAQLGAIALWRNYKRNRESALDRFDAALSLGYSVPISGIYDTAGIKFDFSKDYIHELMHFIRNELFKLM